MRLDRRFGRCRVHWERERQIDRVGSVRRVVRSSGWLCTRKRDEVRVIASVARGLFVLEFVI